MANNENSSQAYQKLGLGGQFSINNSAIQQPKESPPFISFSADGLAAGSIRISDFDKNNKDTLYKSSGLLKYLGKILVWDPETQQSRIDLSQLSDEERAEITSSLSETESSELDAFSSNGITSTPYGIMVPGIGDLPVFLKSLYQILENKNNIYYYPLTSSLYWYRGIKGLDFSEKAAELLINRKRNTSIYLFNISEKDTELGAPSLLDEDLKWPKPLSKNILQTSFGLRPYSNSLKRADSLIFNWNLIDPQKLENWARQYNNNSGWAALNNEDGAPCHKNITGSTDTLILINPENTIKLRVSDLAKSSSPLKNGKTYTLSFYARVLGLRTDFPDFSKDVAYPDPAALSLTSELVTVSSNNMYNPIQYITIYELNSNNGEEETLKEKEALFYSWKRYYYTFTFNSSTNEENETEINSDLILNFHALNKIIKTSGWLLEETGHPSPYDPRILDCRKNYISENTSDQLLLYPILYLLPVQANSNLITFPKKGTFIYRQYIEDKAFSDNHLCSLGLTNGKYITWGLKGTTAGIWYGNSELCHVDPPLNLQNLQAQKETWLTNIVTFSFNEAGKFEITWTLFGREPGLELINLIAEIDNIGQPEFSYCFISSQHIERAALKWSYANFNLSLGSNMKLGESEFSEETDPFNQLFSTSETELFDFSGDIFSDFVFIPIVLSSEQKTKLAMESTFLKIQSDSNQEEILTLFASSIEQGHIQLSKISQAYVNNPESSINVINNFNPQN